MLGFAKGLLLIALATTILLISRCARSPIKQLNIDKEKFAELLAAHPDFIDTTKKVVHDTSYIHVVKTDTVIFNHELQLDSLLHVIEMDTVKDQVKKAKEQVKSDCKDRVITNERILYKDRTITQTIKVPCPACPELTQWQILKKYWLGFFIAGFWWIVIVAWIIFKIFKKTLI